MSDKYASRMEKRQQQRKENKNKNKHKKGWAKRIILGAGIALILVMILSGISLALTLRGAPELKASDLEMPQSTRVYDQNGEKIDTLFHEENRINVSIDEVPDVMKDAIISIEDKRFYDHNGIDIRRLFGAVRSNIKKGWGSEGGSTLTQQVIKRSLLTPEKTLKRKVQEAWLARKLEKKYSKDEILELYLNNVYFGHGAYGLKTASDTYFGEKDLSKLNVSQAALLAGLPNSPSATDPFKHPEKAEKRRNQVLTAMVDNDILTEEEGEEAKSIPVTDIVLDEEKKPENDNPYNAYVDAVYDQLVKQEKVVSEEEFFQGGLEIYTYLDSDAQKKVYDLLHSDAIAYPDDDFETGISLVDTETGVIKAVGGGRNFKAIRYSNYGTHIKHHPGSTIKPIIDYGPAIEHLQWSTAHVLTDEPYEYSNGDPINEWDGEYWGDVSIRRALEWSRNIPALKAFQAVGADKAQAFASDLGIQIDPIYESAAIGGFDGVSPLQMAAAYAAFGNGGTYHEPSAVKKVIFPDGKEWEPEVESHQAMQDYTAYMITDMLKTVINSGTGTQANVSGIPVAGKTGSTNIRKEDREKYGIDDGLRDAWFAGYTTDYSLTVWTGYPSLTNEDGEVKYIRYDGTQDIAKQLFRELMTDISSPDTADFVMPDSVISAGSELHVRGASPTQPENDSEPSNDEQNDNNNNNDNNNDNEEEENEVESNNQDNEQNNEDQENEGNNEQVENGGNEGDNNEEQSDSNDKGNQNSNGQNNDHGNEQGNDNGQNQNDGNNKGQNQNNGNNQGQNNGQNGNNQGPENNQYENNQNGNRQRGQKSDQEE